MNILKIQVMRGPNVWSNYRKKLIVMKLDLEEAEQFPTNKIPGFAEALQALLPSLQTHRCSADEEGGFLNRVREGTWLGHVIEHVALELQTLSGMDTGYGRTRSTKTPGVYHVVFSYEVERAGVYAAKAAVRLVAALAEGKTYDELDEDIAEMSYFYRREKFGPSTQSIIDEAVKRDIPYVRMNNASKVMFGQGCYQKAILATETSATSNMAVDLASNKEATRQLLTQNYVPMPKGIVVSEVKELNAAIAELGFPLVAKPINGNHGRGITTNINSICQAYDAFNLARKVSEDVIIERFLKGPDYRFLVINYKLVAVAKRRPAMIKGDGVSDIQQLINQVNNDPRRGDGHQNVLTKIVVDEITAKILAENKLTLHSILPKDERLFLKDTANLSSGGTATDVTDLVHPANVFLAERIARLMNLDICGIDIIADDIINPITEKNGGVLEVNAGPGFRMHLSPTNGLARNVAEPVMEMLYPSNAPSRVPLIAVTGTNGKTTTTRLIAHLAKTAGHKVGFTTTDGIYINGTQVYAGDCSGPASANVVLRDPIVDFAVLECARGGIIRSGLGFDKCNISIVTNISEDHLGLQEIHTVEDLAKVKIVVPRSTFDNGYAILNADDDLVFRMKKELDCNIALFSMHADNERIERHCRNGGTAAFVEKGWFVLARGEWKSRLIKVNEVPLTFGGSAEVMIKNVLPSILAGSLSKFSIETITRGLKTFIPSADLTPGRMNVFKFKSFTMMVDYAHNEGGYTELKKYLSTVNASVKIGIISATGDRRPQDIRTIGKLAAEMFDEIIIKHDRDGRGRTNEELTQLLKEGIESVNTSFPVKVISDELTAIHSAMERASSNAFICICADNIPATIEYIKEAQRYESDDTGSSQLVKVSNI